MYEWKDIEVEIETYFKEVVSDIEDGENLIPMMKAECQEILKTDIENACERIKGLRNVYGKRDTAGQWFRLLVYCVTYQYLSRDDASLSQSDVLKKMGLPPDEFTKHWDMYSPNFEIRKNYFLNIKTGFARDEVESDKVYVAMIHYLVGQADVVTDTFIDVFGKMGVIPAQCANIYPYRKSFIDNVRWLSCIQCICKPVSFYMQIKKIQAKISMKDTMYEKKELISDLRLQYIKSAYWDSYICDEEKAASYFFLCYFETPYWEDSLLENKLSEDNLTKFDMRWNREFHCNIKENTKTEEEPVKQYVAELDTRYDIKDEGYSYDKIKEFESLCVEDFQEISKLFKKVQFIDCNIMERMKNNFRSYQECFLQDYFLYIDIPKYFRERERFNFSEGDYLHIIRTLNYHKGYWIMTWKNYIYKQDMITTGNILDYVETDSYSSILGKIKEIQKVSAKQLYVFRYRRKSKSKSNSLLFIMMLYNKNCHPIHKDFDIESKRIGEIKNGKTYYKNL